MAPMTSWNLDEVIPSGGTGTVVVTTNIFDALRKSCKTLSPSEAPPSSVEISESISTAEGVSLLYKHSRWEPKQGTEVFRADAERIVRRLNNDVFSVDLAGAHIAANVPMADLAVRVRQYLIDSAQQRDRLQRGDRYKSAGLREQAYWLAFEPSMSPLQKDDPAQACMLPVLKLLALFPKGSVLDEMLRLAAIGLDKSTQNPRIDAPPLLRRLLAVRANGSWDDSFYHDAVSHLKQYDLLRETTGPWPGVTVHSLIRRQIKREAGNWQEALTSFVVLVGAACRTLHETPAKYFEPHAVLHLPSNKWFLPKRQHGPDTAFGLACLSMSRIWLIVHRYDVAEDLLSAAHTALAEARGRDDRLTLEALENRALNSRQRGDLKQAEFLQEQVVDGLSRTLGAEAWETLDSMERLTSIYRDQGRNAEAADLQRKALAARRKRGEHLNQQHVLHAMNRLANIYIPLQRYPEAEELAAASLEGKREFNGDKHPATLDAMRELAEIHWYQDQERKARTLKKECVEGYEQFMGNRHPSTLAAIESLSKIHDRPEPECPNALATIHVSSPPGKTRLHHGSSSDFLPAVPPMPHSFGGNVPWPQHMFPMHHPPVVRSSSLNSGVRRRSPVPGWVRNAA